MPLPKMLNLTKNNSFGCQKLLFLNNKIDICRRNDYCCHINIYMKQFIAEKDECVSMSSKNESNINLRKEYTNDTCDSLTNCYKSCNSIVPIFLHFVSKNSFLASAMPPPKMLSSYVCYDTGNFAKYNNGLDNCYSKCFTDKYKCPYKNTVNKENLAIFIFVVVVVCIFVVALFVSTLCDCNYLYNNSTPQVSHQESFNSV